MIVAYLRACPLFIIPALFLLLMTAPVDPARAKTSTTSVTLASDFKGVSQVGEHGHHDQIIEP